MKGIILVLGAPNSDEGILSDIARNRLDSAKKFYLNNPGFNILCTGGFGPHFNTTSTPHAAYAKKYLIENGIPDNSILEYVLSSNTIEDAILAKPLIDKYKPQHLIVITSDFHMRRAALIFTHELKHHNLIFVEAKSTMDPATLERLVAHEQKAIQRFMENL